MDDIPNIYLMQLQSRVGGIAHQLVRIRCTTFCPVQTWQPAMNAYRYESGYRVFVELAGVDEGQIDLQIERQRLIIRGNRRLPVSSHKDEPAQQVLCLEIDEGPFERAVLLPEEVNPTSIVARQQNGLLIIDIPLRQSEGRP